MVRANKSQQTPVPAQTPAQTPVPASAEAEAVVLQKKTMAAGKGKAKARVNTGLTAFVLSTGLMGEALKTCLNGIVSAMVEAWKTGTDAFWHDNAADVVRVNTNKGEAMWTRGRARRNMGAKILSDALWGMVMHATMGADDESHLKAESSYHGLCDSMGLSHWSKGMDVGDTSTELTQIRHRLQEAELTMDDGTTSKAIRTIRHYGPSIVLGGFAAGQNWDRDKVSSTSSEVPDFQ